MSTHIYLPMKMEQTECSETSAYKIQTPGNYPKESVQYTLLVHAKNPSYWSAVFIAKSDGENSEVYI